MMCDTFFISAQNNVYYAKAMEYKNAGNYTELIKNLKLSVAQEPDVILYKEALADALFTKKIYHTMFFCKVYVHLRKI